MQDLYHGSYIQIDKPRIVVSNRMLDYGTGFYTTSDETQAIRFTEKFTPLGKARVINVYECDFDTLKSKLRVREFNDANQEWLEYVVANRSGKGINEDFDVVIGPVANDRVYSVVDFFEAGVYSVDEAISRMMSYRLVDQVTFKSNAALEFLNFKDSIFVEDLNNG